LTWLTTLCDQLAADRAILMGAPSPFEPFARHQQERFGLTGSDLRLPEHFRGEWDRAEVCFLGPHVIFDPKELPPPPDCPLTDYVAYCSQRPGRRDPYGHYQAITGGRPWLAAELVHWPCEKELALQVLGSPRGPAIVDAGLALTWSLLAESPVRTLVLTGNDALRWVLPRLGRKGGKLPGVTQLHGQVMGEYDLPGAPGRRLRVVASCHWSRELPLFMRKLPGLQAMQVSEAIDAARQMISAVL